jgi:hypothetical protein
MEEFEEAIRDAVEKNIIKFNTSFAKCSDEATDYLNGLMGLLTGRAKF